MVSVFRLPEYPSSSASSVFFQNGIQHNTQTGFGFGSGSGVVVGNGSTTVDDEPEITAAERSLLQKMIRTTLVNDKAQIEIKQKDPTSPLYSAKSFEQLNLPAELLRGVYTMGFLQPSRIQEATLPLLLKNPPQNLIAQSQSGTGKTAAFVLAMLRKVDPSIKQVQILLLCPTMELALQIGNVIAEMGKFCNEISVVMAVAGERVYGTITDHIVIGTPGKVMDWAFRCRLFDVSKIRMLVLDEADVMLATQGYNDQCTKLIRRLPATTQRLLFSATYSREVMKFAETVVPDATIIRLKREEESLDNINHVYIKCQTGDQKYKAIANLYGVLSIGQCMIFTQTRATAMDLYKRLTGDGHAVALLSGELTVEERITVLNKFRDGQEKILISTNVAARGIDIEQVTMVINYDLPLTYPDRLIDCDTYLHRTGRTGRFGKAGLAINFVCSQSDMESLDTIRKYFGKPIHELNPESVEELENLEK